MLYFLKLLSIWIPAFLYLKEIRAKDASLSSQAKNREASFASISFRYRKAGIQNRYQILYAWVYSIGKLERLYFRYLLESGKSSILSNWHFNQYSLFFRRVCLFWPRRLRNVILPRVVAVSQFGVNSIFFPGKISWLPVRNSWLPVQYQRWIPKW